VKKQEFCPGSQLLVTQAGDLSCSSLPSDQAEAVIVVILADKFRCPVHDRKGDQANLRESEVLFLLRSSPVWKGHCITVRILAIV
jgi:hypothetical protein